MRFALAHCSAMALYSVFEGCDWDGDGDDPDAGAGDDDVAFALGLGLRCGILIYYLPRVDPRAIDCPGALGDVWMK